MIQIAKIIVLILLVLTALILAARLIFPLPDISDRPEENALPHSPDTVLGARMAEALRDHPGQSGVLALSDGHHALGARLALATDAQASIDAQYYIWHDDVSGRLLLKALHDAAARGVRVRLLLDDNGIPGLDPTIAALDAMENFEVRLFNPSTIRNPKMAGYTFSFLRMNRRMHNKSFIVDGAAAIIGGRNIGDEYFRIGEGAYYHDLDVLGVGAIVPETAAAFDEYWNSASVYGLDGLVSPDVADMDGFLAGAAEAQASEAAQVMAPPDEVEAQRRRQQGEPLEWTTVQLVYDDPRKGQGQARRDDLMITRLASILGQVNSELNMISAYFVPGKPGTEFFASLAERGVKVRILTNALRTTDVLMVHSGYVKYRRALLRAGVELYELRPNAGMPQDDLKPLGASSASLHAKTFTVDGDRVFIGSFNFDPRSALLNCEMGFLIDSETIARTAGGTFSGPLAPVTYRPVLSPEEDMIWIETNPDSTLLHTEEPGATNLDRLTLWILGVLPIEWLL